MSFSFVLPIKVNANARGHTWFLGKKVKIHREAAGWQAQAGWRKFAKRREAELLAAGLVITLTRVAPRELDDHDNLRTALKPCVDGIAIGLGLKNDRDRRVRWDYAQRRAGVREYAVEVTIAPRDDFSSPKWRPAP